MTAWNVVIVHFESGSGYPGFSSLGSDGNTGYPEASSLGLTVVGNDPETLGVTAGYVGRGLGVRLIY